MEKGRILILGDKKDLTSIHERKDYRDGNGRLFWHIIYSAGLKPAYLDFAYVDEGVPDIGKYSVVVPLGQRALSKVDGGRVRSVRGSVLGTGDPWIIPTIHPRDLKKPFEMFRDAQVETAQLVFFDLQKVAKVFNHGFTLPEERFILEPTLKDLEEFVEKSKEYPYLGVDIEGTGLNTDYTDIVTIGFAGTRNDAFVFPFSGRHGVAYWSVDEADRAYRLLEELLLKRKLIFQNGYGYDIPVLRRHGYRIPWENYIGDTMLLHHAIDPELPHNIGFISSVWGHQPYWKEESPWGKGIDIYDFDQVELRRYNARDCTSLIDIYGNMYKHAVEIGVEHIVKREMEITAPTIYMKEQGIGKDRNKEVQWQRYLNKELNQAVEGVTKDFNLPEGFNFNSPQHMHWLLYGIKGKTISNLAKEAERYEKEFETVQYCCQTCGGKKSKRYEVRSHPATLDLSCKKCGPSVYERTSKPPTPAKPAQKDTGVYKTRVLAKQVLELTPFTKPKSFRPPRTDGGDYGIGKSAITRFLNAVHKRQDELNGQKRPNVVEQQELERTALFLVRYRDLARLLKLKASFFSIDTGRDGRIHPTLLIQGAATGRYACVNPNAQQMPNARSLAGGKVRDIFTAIGDGYSLLSCDYSNLEVQVGARFMEDQVLISQLESGLNIHDENTKTFFNITSSDPRWSTFRGIAKTIQFGRLFYGGSDKGIFSKVRAEDPDSGLTLEDFIRAVNAYMGQHPAFVKFMDVVQARAEKERVSINGYGRLRNLYGPVQKLSRQALNSPIQGSAADFLFDVMVRLWEKGLGRLTKSYMALQIHDELLFMIHDDEKEDIYKMIYTEMTRPQTITSYLGNKYTFSVPIDSEAGQNWGSLEPIDLQTGKYLDKESKH